MSDRPAILGGSPIFTEKQPFERPTLPPYSSVDAQMGAIFQSGMLTKGRYLAEFESGLAGYLGVRHAVGVSSCTIGLLLLYKSLGLKGEVIVPSFTFMATVHPLLWNDLRPIFVDAHPDTWNLDPAQVEAAITPRTAAIVGVHVFGNPAAAEQLEEIAVRHGLPLVFDAAHAFGSLYRGAPLGGHGRAEVFSTSPTKPLVTGEGGIVATNDDAVADFLRLGREYGNVGDYDSIFPGLNARMQEFNAVLGLKTLETLEANVQARNALAAIYRKELADAPGIAFQLVALGDRCSYKDLTVMVDEAAFGLSRDALAAALLAEGVDTRRYFDPPVHRHTLYRPYWEQQAGELPVTDRLARQALSLPMYAHLSPDAARQICQAVRRIQRHAAEVRAAGGPL
jgi:dTDP-4-amino-4,6-dideoxygalactose transaminase